MDGAGSMYGGGEVRIEFWWGDFGEVEHLEDPGIDGRIILKWILRNWVGVMDWINLAQYSGRWRTLVNAVLKLRFPENKGNF
jgi:hypothetical protein